jgi:hypothetical protein
MLHDILRGLFSLPRLYVLVQGYVLYMLRVWYSRQGACTLAHTESPLIKLHHYSTHQPHNLTTFLKLSSKLYCTTKDDYLLYNIIGNYVSECVMYQINSPCNLMMMLRQ